ncbi:unnamed protein product [Prorocentrum cordatum]|uniref:Alpha-L-rhamnosidase C-terminal domain-containing protein n=1 Tax=Prorocentrum cordatum TaxID=2364126 RepID=A0ABN9QWU1_9DINO|nr:unnamed protein product [Polarella glacialis]
MPSRVRPTSSSSSATASASVRVPTPLGHWCGHFEVRPQPGALAWAELKLPVLSGFIEVRVEQSASEFELTLVAPGNTQATACLPRLGGASAELVVDGRPRSGHASGDFLCVAGVGSGRHTIIRRARGGEVFV